MTDYDNLDGRLCRPGCLREFIWSLWPPFGDPEKSWWGLANCVRGRGHYYGRPLVVAGHWSMASLGLSNSRGARAHSCYLRAVAKH